MLAEEMKLRFIIAVILLVNLLVFANRNIAQAGWNAINSGYGVTTNWHGQDVPLGESVTAWAGTTDDAVEIVEFKWLNHSEDIVWRENVSVDGPYLTPNVPGGAPQEIIDWAESVEEDTPVWYANNTKIPNSLGNWTVKATFYNVTHERGKNHSKFRATSFNVVPEAPFGTIVILLTMLGALGVFALKRKHSFSVRLQS
jgi:hypothetical protein